MTYAIQAIAGTAIALGTFVSVYWRKIKKVFVKEFNASNGKNAESDDLVFKEENGTVRHSLDNDHYEHVSGKPKESEKKGFKGILIALIPAADDPIIMYLIPSPPRE